jgi:hypothetical protein
MSLPLDRPDLASLTASFIKRIFLTPLDTRNVSKTLPQIVRKQIFRRFDIKGLRQIERAAQTWDFAHVAQ